MTTFFLFFYFLCYVSYFFKFSLSSLCICITSVLNFASGGLFVSILCIFFLEFFTVFTFGTCGRFPVFVSINYLELLCLLVLVVAVCSKCPAEPLGTVSLVSGIFQVCHLCGLCVPSCCNWALLAIGMSMGGFASAGLSCLVSCLLVLFFVEMVGWSSGVVLKLAMGSLVLGPLEMGSLAGHFSCCLCSACGYLIWVSKRSPSSYCLWWSCRYLGKTKLITESGCHLFQTWSYLAGGTGHAKAACLGFVSL